MIFFSSSRSALILTSSWAGSNRRICKSLAEENARVRWWVQHGFSSHVQLEGDESSFMKSDRLKLKHIEHAIRGPPRTEYAGWRCPNDARFFVYTASVIRNAFSLKPDLSVSDIVGIGRRHQQTALEHAQRYSHVTCVSTRYFLPSLKCASCQNGAISAAINVRKQFVEHYVYLCLRFCLVVPPQDLELKSAGPSPHDINTPIYRKLGLALDLF